MPLRGLPGDELTAGDLERLEARWIDRETAERAGFRHVNSLEGGALVGRNGAGDYEGLAIPYALPGEEGVRGYRLRLERPPVFVKDGEQRPGYRYLAAPGERNRLYFPIGTDPRHLADKDLRIALVEGEFKTTALYRLSLHGLGDAAERPRFLPLGLSGVANWRGRIGKTTNAEGQRVDQKGTIPDLDRIVWKDRHVTIAFDRDTHANEFVMRERNELARELRRRGAKVFLFMWPVEHVNAKGIDDLLAAAGPDLVLHLLSQVESWATATNWRARLILTEDGKVRALLANAVVPLRDSAEWLDVLKWDDFAGRITAEQTPFNRKPGPWSDNDDRQTTEWLQRAGIGCAVQTASDAVAMVALENSFHPVRDYLEGLEWDGVGRLDDWLTLYLSVDPNDYTRAVAAKWLISAVARIYRPGAKADCCLILEGAQGIKKSTAVKVLAGDWFTDDAIDFDQQWAAMSTFGSWIVELAELADMKRAELSKVKAFLSRAVDHFRPPYGRHLVHHPRQCVFVGTVNDATYLRDDTGARRFWPVTCGEIKIPDLELDRDQIWAEAVQRFKAGASWWLEDLAVIKQAEEAQEERYEQDPWHELIALWLRAPYQRIELGRAVQPYNSMDEDVTVLDILLHAIGKGAAQIIPTDYHRISRIMKKLGWIVYRPQHGHVDHRERRYRPKN